MRTAEIEAIVARAAELAASWKHASVSFEHLLVAIVEAPGGQVLLRATGAELQQLQRHLIPHVRFQDLSHPVEIERFLRLAEDESARRGRDLGIGELLAELLALPPVDTIQLFHEHVVRRVDVLNSLLHGITRSDGPSQLPAARLRGARSWTWPWRGARGRYHVVMHDDAYSTHEVATACLVNHFRLPLADAQTLVRLADTAGRARIGTYPLREAIRRVDLATRAAHREGAPLRFTFEPASPADSRPPDSLGG